MKGGSIHPIFLVIGGAAWMFAHLGAGLLGVAAGTATIIGALLSFFAVIVAAYISRSRPKKHRPDAELIRAIVREVLAEEHDPPSPK